MSATLLARDSFRIGFGCLERRLTDVALIPVGLLFVGCLARPECCESVEESHLVSPCQSVEDGMDSPEGCWLFELGGATVLTGVGRAAETPDDAFGHTVAALRAFPRFGHTGMFRLRIVKVCGLFTWFDENTPSQEQVFLSAESMVSTAAVTGRIVCIYSCQEMIV
jgi:hypothetical protein